MSIRKVLSHLAAAAGIVLFLLLILMMILIALIGQGWQHPFQSLQAKAEMRSYLEETRPGQELRITFPTYNPTMDDFSAFIKDGEGQTLFGLSWCEAHGFTELEAFQNNDGRWLMLQPNSQNHIMSPDPALVFHKNVENTVEKVENILCHDIM